MREGFGCPHMPSVSSGACASAAGPCARKPFRLNREGARGKLRQRSMESLVRKRSRCSPGGEGRAGTCQGHLPGAARPPHTQPHCHPRPQPAACASLPLWGKTGCVGGGAARPPALRMAARSRGRSRTLLIPQLGGADPAAPSPSWVVSPGQPRSRDVPLPPALLFAPF